MEVKKLVLVPDWEDRVYHPSGSGTIDLKLAKQIWPDAKVKKS